MARYALSLPGQLKHDAEAMASQQGVSLNQFILWAVAEKVGALSQHLDDSDFPHVTYRRGASGHPVPVVRGTGLRIQTLVVAAETWGMEPQQIASEYGISEALVRESLAFYAAHRREIDLALAEEASIEADMIDG